MNGRVDRRLPANCGLPCRPAPDFGLRRCQWRSANEAKAASGNRPGCPCSQASARRMRSPSEATDGDIMVSRESTGVKGILKSLLTGACLLAVLAGCASAPQKHPDTAAARTTCLTSGSRIPLSPADRPRWGNPRSGDELRQTGQVNPGAVTDGGPSGHTEEAARPLTVPLTAPASPIPRKRPAGSVESDAIRGTDAGVASHSGSSESGVRSKQPGPCMSPAPTCGTIQRHLR